MTLLGGTCSNSDAEFDSSAGLAKSIFVIPGADKESVECDFGAIGERSLDLRFEADVLPSADGVGGNLNDRLSEPLAACLGVGLRRGDVTEKLVRDSSMT